MIRTLLYLAVLLPLLSCGKHEVQRQQTPGASAGRPVLYVKDVVLEDGHWYDFHTESVWTDTQLAALDDSERQKVDMGYSGGILLNHATKEYRTRFYVMDMTAKVYAAIKSRDDLMAQVHDLNWNQASMRLELATSTTYVAFKTYLPGEGNCYGIIAVSEVKPGYLKFDFKFCDLASNPDYSSPRKVTISNGRFYVDGKEFYVNGAAATMNHAQMADYGANVCRIYSSSKQTRGLLDELHERGLMCYVGLPAKAYSGFATGEATYDDPAYRAAAISSVMEIVESLKDHPAVLCWSLGNELEAGGNASREGYYKYYGELAAAVHEADPNHPVTAAFTETPTAFKVSKINEYCPQLDFLSFNSYYSVLRKYEASSATSYTQMLAQYGWTKPYMITEFGPTGTWQRNDAEMAIRVNDWKALIQLTSCQAAEKYIECWKMIRNYRNCLGGIAFWWGYQTHGQVLGWYPFFTKDMVPLSPVEAMESCWKGISYNPVSPLLEDWASAVEMNGMTLADPSSASSGRSEKNPVVVAGQKCTAKVNASCRSGKPSSLRYKWFIYRDCSYTETSGKLSWTDCESVYSIYGQHKSMNEDAGKELFSDRTLKSVSFTAPSQPGNYRLYVIVTDASVAMASSACLNFKVINQQN